MYTLIERTEQGPVVRNREVEDPRIVLRHAMRQADREFLIVGEGRTVHVDHGTVDVTFH